MSDENWERVLDSIPEMVIITDNDGKIEYINLLEEGINTTREEVIGTSAMDWMEDEHRGIMSTSIRQAKNGSITKYETSRVDAEGKKRIYQSTVSSLGDGKVLILARDITSDKALVEAEKMIFAQQEQIKRVDICKELTRLIVHELSNGLAVLSVNVDTLQQVVKGEDDILSDMSNVCSRGTKVIDLLRNLTKATNSEFDEITDEIRQEYKQKFNDMP